MKLVMKPSFHYGDLPAFVAEVLDEDKGTPRLFISRDDGYEPIRVLEHELATLLMARGWKVSR